MLWGLEALKMFDARLTPSLDKIENARKDLVLKMDRVSDEHVPHRDSGLSKVIGARETA